MAYQKLAAQFLQKKQKPGLFGRLMGFFSQKKLKNTHKVD